nr:hypothetical protein [Tanacetum cinerariifolium]
MNNKKRIVNLEYLREMLHICLRLPNQTFDELSFEEEILAFFRYLGDSEEIKKITDAHILCGMYHKKTIDFAYLLWEDFVYQVKHKDAKKSNEMYYLRDDQMFTTIKLVSRHQNTQQFGAILPVELINEDIINFAAYMEYYDIASGATPPKTKERVPDVPTDESDEEISWKSSDEDDDDVDNQSDTADNDDSDDQEDEYDQDYDDQKNDDQDDNDDDQDIDNDSDDFVYPKLSIHKEEAKDEESFDPILQTPENSNDEGNDDASLGMNVGGEEGHDVEDDNEELYRDVNINLEAGQIQSDRLRDEAQAENEEFLNKLDENIQKIIKEQVKEQVKVQVSKILPKIKKIVSEQLEAEVLTRSSNSSKTSYVMAVDLSELELKKILIEKMESNKSIHKSDQQRNLYKALVDAYECDKIILDTYRDSVTFKRCRNDADKDEEPSARSYRRGAKVDNSRFGHQEFERGAADDQPIAEASQHIECASSRKYTTSVTKIKAADYGHIKWIKDLFYGFAVNRESARDVYLKCRIIAVAELQIIEWHNYKHLDWITVRIDDDKLYKFKEGDFKRLRIQDTKDMLLLLVQEKLTNLTVKESFAFNVSLRMFIRSIVIQWRMEDLQLGVKSYQKKLNITKPDTDGTLNDVRTALDDHLKEPEGYTQGYPLVSVEVLRYDKMSKSKNMGILPTEMELILEQTQQEHLSDTYVFTMKMEILLKPTSNKLMVAGNLVKDILLKLNLPDHRTLKDGGEGTCFQLSQRFIATCSYPTIKYKDIMKAQVHVLRLPLL